MTAASTDPQHTAKPNSFQNESQPHPTPLPIPPLTVSPPSSSVTRTGS